MFGRASEKHAPKQNARSKSKQQSAQFQPLYKRAQQKPMQLSCLSKKKGGTTLNNLIALLADSDKRLIAVILLILIQENGDKGLILALIYILFA